MTAFPGSDNAIAYAQFRLRGGWKNVGATGVAYGLAVAGTMVASLRMAAGPPAQVYAAWLYLLLGVQGMLLFLFAGSRVTAAIRHDVNTRIIESHRLMPVGAGEAVAGYVAGAASQALVLAGVTLLIGAVAAQGAGARVNDWLAANAVLGLFCLTVWVVLAYLSFLVRTPFAWVVPLGLIAAFSEGQLFAIVPALTVFWSPLTGRSLFAMTGVGGPAAFSYAVSALVQIAVMVTCFAAARRKYGRDDAVGLGPGLGLCLLAVTAAAAWVGIAEWKEFRPEWLRRFRNQNVETQLICSLVLLMLMAIIPVAAAARLERDWLRRRARDPAAAGRRPVWGLLVALAAGLVVAVLPSAVGYAVPTERALPVTPGFVLAEITRPWAGTALVVVLALAAFGYVLRLAHRLHQSPARFGIGWFVVAWVGPIIADAIRYARADAAMTGSERAAGAFGAIAACSPGGAVISFWDRPTPDFPIVPVAVLAGLVLLAAVVYHTWPDRRARAAR